MQKRGQATRISLSNQKLQLTRYLRFIRLIKRFILHLDKYKLLKRFRKLKNIMKTTNTREWQMSRLEILRGLGLWLRNIMKLKRKNWLKRGGKSQYNLRI